MSSQSSSAANGGIGFFGLLTLAFIVLKLTGYIHWSWLWVLAPIWMSFVLAAVIFAVVLIVVAATRR